MTANRNNAVVWTELPATDFARAVGFYETVLGISLRQEDMGPMKLGVFPYGEGGVSGAVIFGPGYRPSVDGGCIYLNADGRLDAAMARVEAAGGKIAGPIIDLPPGMGRFVHILDTEGNRLGLHEA